MCRRLSGNGSDGEVRYVASPVWGWLRVLAGMLRANRPCSGLESDEAVQRAYGNRTPPTG